MSKKNSCFFYNTTILIKKIGTYIPIGIYLSNFLELNIRMRKNSCFFYQNV